MTTLLDGVLSDVEAASEQTDLLMPWPTASAVTLIAELADVIDGIVAGEQAEGDLASLTTAIGVLTTEMRARASDIATAAGAMPTSHGH